jgi:xanthine/uracil permease
MNVRRVVPIIIGVILLLLGIGFASQGAGMMGGSALMDNNPTFIYVGALVAIIGVALIAFGALWKPKASMPAAV